MFNQYHLTVKTPGRAIVNITEDIMKFISKAQIVTGVCHVFLQHTSASLILCENADPLVQRDLEAFIERFIPDGDEIYQHIAEGLDDMSSHVKTVFTNSFLVIPITNNKLGLGTWQGIYLWEHRFKSHQRQLTISIYGVA